MPVRLDAREPHWLRQRGECRLAHQLYGQLQLDGFWRKRLPDLREGIEWRRTRPTQVRYSLIRPNSEWPLHRLPIWQSAVADLPSADDALAEITDFARCLDKLSPHETALFDHLNQRWRDLFGA